MPDKSCGRMDEHPAHDWPGVTSTGDWFFQGRLVNVTNHCDGKPVSEGAQACMDCGNPTANGGPRCIPCQRIENEYREEMDRDYWRE